MLVQVLLEGYSLHLLKDRRTFKGGYGDGMGVGDGSGYGYGAGYGSGSGAFNLGHGNGHGNGFGRGDGDGFGGNMLGGYGYRHKVEDQTYYVVEE